MFTPNKPKPNYDNPQEDAARLQRIRAGLEEPEDGLELQEVRKMSASPEKPNPTWDRVRGLVGNLQNRLGKLREKLPKKPEVEAKTAIINVKAVEVNEHKSIGMFGQLRQKVAATDWAKVRQHFAGSMGVLGGSQAFQVWEQKLQLNQGVPFWNGPKVKELFQKGVQAVQEKFKTRATRDEEAGYAEIIPGLRAEQIQTLDGPLTERYQAAGYNREVGALRKFHEKYLAENLSQEDFYEVTLDEQNSQTLDTLAQEIIDRYVEQRSASYGDTPWLDQQLDTTERENVARTLQLTALRGPLQEVLARLESQGLADATQDASRVQARLEQLPSQSTQEQETSTVTSLDELMEASGSLNVNRSKLTRLVKEVLSTPRPTPPTPTSPSNPSEDFWFSESEESPATEAEPTVEEKFDTPLDQPTDDVDETVFAERLADAKEFNRKFEEGNGLTYEQALALAEAVEEAGQIQEVSDFDEQLPEQDESLPSHDLTNSDGVNPSEEMTNEQSVSSSEKGTPFVLGQEPTKDNYQGTAFVRGAYRVPQSREDEYQGTPFVLNQPTPKPDNYQGQAFVLGAYQKPQENTNIYEGTAFNLNAESTPQSETSEAYQGTAFVLDKESPTPESAELQTTESEELSENLASLEPQEDNLEQGEKELWRVQFDQTYAQYENQIIQNLEQTVGQDLLSKLEINPQEELRHSLQNVALEDLQSDEVVSSFIRQDIQGIAVEAFVDKPLASGDAKVIQNSLTRLNTLLNQSKLQRSGLEKHLRKINSILGQNSESVPISTRIDFSKLTEAELLSKTQNSLLKNELDRLSNEVVSQILDNPRAPEEQEARQDTVESILKNTNYTSVEEVSADNNLEFTDSEIEQASAITNTELADILLDITPDLTEKGSDPEPKTPEDIDELRAKALHEKQQLEGDYGQNKDNSWLADEIEESFKKRTETSESDFSESSGRI